MCIDQNFSLFYSDEDYNKELVAIKAEKDEKVFSKLTEEDKIKIKEDSILLKQMQEETPGKISSTL